jgi:hypothetical protein
VVLSSREARPRRGRGRAATARGTHRKGDAGGLGAQHSARHGTPPSAMPSARRVFPLESYSAYRGAWTPRFDGEWPRASPAAGSNCCPRRDARWVLIIVDRRCDPSITKGKGTVVRLSYLQHTLISRQTPSCLVSSLSPRGGPRDHTALYALCSLVRLWSHLS